MGQGKVKTGEKTGESKPIKSTTVNAGRPGSLVRVWFSNGVNGGDTLVNDAEFGRAPFVLIVEYVPPVKARYGAKLKIQPRDRSVLEQIDRHKLRDNPVFTDRAAVAADTRDAALDGELKTAMTGTGGAVEALEFLWSHKVWWWGARKLSAFVEQQRVVRVTLATLLDGIEVAGTMDEVRRAIKEVTMAIDMIASGLDLGATFDGGGTQIFAPGTRTKTVEIEPGIPPSEWGK